MEWKDLIFVDVFIYLVRFCWDRLLDIQVYEFSYVEDEL